MNKNEEKGDLFNYYVSMGSKLEREISKLKTEYIPNIPLDIENKINEKKKEIEFWSKKIEELYK